MRDQMRLTTPTRSVTVANVRSLLAPVAARSDAVSDDPDTWAAAAAVIAAFGESSAAGGLTEPDLRAACQEVVPDSVFTSRFALFKELGMLLPVFDKRHEHRYVLNPVSAIGDAVVRRLAVNGGVAELSNLLLSTRRDLEAGRATREQVAEALQTGRQQFTINSDYLTRLVENSPLEELVAQRRHHNNPRIHEDLATLPRLVREQFPDLAEAAAALLDAALQYVTACRTFMERLIEQGAHARDFSLLDPEEYLTAARTASEATLAEVFTTIVFDAPLLLCDPQTVASVLDGYQPSTRSNAEVPLAPDTLFDGSDPVGAALAEDAKDRKQLLLQVESLLGGASEQDLTDALRGVGWPATATTVAAVLASSRDADSPFTATLANGILVDPTGPVTHLTPITVSRQSTLGTLTSIDPLDLADWDATPPFDRVEDTA
jgi:hypothetical protein